MEIMSRYLAGLFALFPMLAACGGDSPQAGSPDASPDSGLPAPAGSIVFDDSFVHAIDLTLAAADWQAIIDEAAAYVNDNADRPYYPAQASFDGDPLDGDVGMRLKGHISIDLAEGHRYPLKLDFNRYEDGLELDGLKKLNLNTDFDGPTLPIMRDHLSYGAWRELGVAASRTSFSRVSVNGEDLGVYVLVEQVDGDFIERGFEPPYGDLYKPEQQTGSLEYRGPNIDDYPDIGHKWPDESDHAALLHAIEVLNSGTMSELGEVFDVEGVLTYMAGNVVLGSGDYYPSTGHNYYLYEETPGRFTMLPWDMNGSQEPFHPDVCGPMAGLLSRRLLEDPANMDLYFALLAEFLQTAGSKEFLTARLDSAADLLGAAVSIDEVEGLRQDIATRTDSLEAALASTTDCE